MASPIAQDWLGAPANGAGFGLTVDGVYRSYSDGDWSSGGESRSTERSGTSLRAASLHYGLGLRVTVCTRTFDGCGAVERWVEVENVGQESRAIGRVDSLCVRLNPAPRRLHTYTGTWGKEFSPAESDLARPVIVETKTGRSSSGCHPWFALEADGAWLCGAVAWAGNHIVRFEPGANGLSVSGGLHDWEIGVTLGPGETFVAPSVFLSAGPDRDAAAREFHRWGRLHGYPKTRLAADLPVEWNHWWPYEDKDINDAAFRANATQAAAMGFQAVTLDAGWFGAPGSTDWWDQRGDWDKVNTDRFPNGIRPLADDAHSKGLKFGIWCEIEAIGSKAALNESRPDFVARRDGKPLGTACFGNPAARDWAVATLNRLITDYKADWIKLDYNVEVGAGCNRTDHGHGAGDGLYRHLHGLFEVVERVRKAHPNVLLEGCSSGGLRIDLGWLQHVPCVFLSDPDYPAHDLQLFWGAMDYVAPNACLHWSWSQNKGAFPNLDPKDPALSDARLDYIVRTGMLGFFGMSQKLPDLPERVAGRFSRHIDVYRRKVAPLVRSADVYRLTGQPLRDGGGDRWCGFQYAMPSDGTGAVFAFRLQGGAPQRVMKLRALKSEHTYTLEWDGTDRRESATGADLMAKGIDFAGLPEEGSALVFVR